MQRRALAILFGVIAMALLAIAVSAIAGAGGSAGGWIVAVSALAIAGWLGSIAVSGLKR